MTTNSINNIREFKNELNTLISKNGEMLYTFSLQEIYRLYLKNVRGSFSIQRVALLETLSEYFEQYFEYFDDSTATALRDVADLFGIPEVEFISEDDEEVVLNIETGDVDIYKESTLKEDRQLKRDFYEWVDSMDEDTYSRAFI